MIFTPGTQKELYEKVKVKIDSGAFVPADMIGNTDHGELLYYWTGWTKYYGNSQTNATLTQGIDFVEYQFEKLQPEANCIIYYGPWRRPSNGDWWTENQSGLWDVLDASETELIDDNVVYTVNNYSLKMNVKVAVAGFNSVCWYPKTVPTNPWNFTVFTKDSIPYLNFYINQSWDITNLHVRLRYDATKYFDADIHPLVTDVDLWRHIALPIGPNWRGAPEASTFQWTEVNSPNWNAINDVFFLAALGTLNHHIHLDGLHFGGIPICRVAKNSTSITNNKLCTKVITDNVGKDDTLMAGDASGLMAQMAHAELLRCQTTPIIGTVKTPIIPDLLPGQLLHLHAKQKSDGLFSIDKDFIATRVNHDMSQSGFTTTVEVSDDVSNGLKRPRFEDINQIFAHYARPEFQDRQASSIKTGELDIKITRLEKDYPS
jgi:hypothetical protein